MMVIAGRKSKTMHTAYSSLRCPVTWLISLTGPGPIPRTVLDPLAICVRPLHIPLNRLSSCISRSHTVDPRILDDSRAQTKLDRLSLEVEELRNVLRLDRDLGLAPSFPVAHEPWIVLREGFVACEGCVGAYAAK